MKTGKYGVKLWCYAVAAFIFGILNLYIGLIAVAAFALLAEKDKWLNNQIMQAVLLYLFYCLAIVLINISVGGLGKLFLLMKIFDASATFAQITTILNDIVFVVYVVFALIAAFRCASEKDGVPFLVKLSDKLLIMSEKRGTKTENNNEENDKKTLDKVDKNNIDE